MIIKFNKIHETWTKKILTAVQNNENLPAIVASLKGSRGSGKTQWVLRVAILAGLIKKCKIFCFKYIASDLPKTLIGDVINILDSLEIKYTYYKNAKLILFGNSSQIEFFGLKQSKSDKINLTGLYDHSYKFDYGFIIKDEISEYEFEASTAIDEAIRGFINGTLMEFRTWNPINPLHWSNKHFLKYCPENKNRMTNQKIGFNKIEIRTEESNNNIEWFLQNNIFSNYLNDINLHNRLTSLIKKDAIRARTMTFGLDGTDETSLFINPNLNKIGNLEIKKLLEYQRILKRKWNFIYGFDYGKINICAIILAISIKNYGLIILESAGFDRKKDSWISDKNVAIYFANKIKTWTKKWNISKAPFFYDYANKSFPEWMVEKIGSDAKLILEPSIKTKLPIRIEYLKNIFDSNNFYINKSCLNNELLKNQIKYALPKINSNGEISGFLSEHDYIDALWYAIASTINDWKNYGKDDQKNKNEKTHFY